MINIRKLETELWEAADLLRADSKVTSQEYCMPVLGLIFLRYAYSRFKFVEADILKNRPVRGGRALPVEADDFKTKSAIFLPEEARYEYLLNLPDNVDMGQAINRAMELIEEQSAQLKGVLPKNYTILQNDLLRELLRIFNNGAFNEMKDDIIGRIYEYFLNKFAPAVASDDGVFFTPKSLVRMIVNIIEPTHGTVLDPACGSGGMFVSSADFIEGYGANANTAMTFYGQEKVDYNAKLCLMNMAVHGLNAKIVSGDEANSFYHDAHNLEGCCDYVMANPPFNVDKVKSETAQNAGRLPFGLPSVNKNKEIGNANYLWISYFHAYLNDTGRAGFVMAASATDSSGKDKDIRKKLIETGDVDVMLSVGNNFFYTKSLPCTLWFFDKAKRQKNKDRVLFIDARNYYTAVDRTLNEWSEWQMKNLNAIVWLYRGETDKYQALIKAYRKEIEEFTWFIPQMRYISILSFIDDQVCNVDTKVAPVEKVKKLYDTIFWGLEHMLGHSSGICHDELNHCGNVENAISEYSKAAEGLINSVELRGAACTGMRTTAKTPEKKQRRELLRVLAESTSEIKQMLAQYQLCLQEALWLKDKFGEGVYQDVPGLCKIADRAAIEEKSWSLTPGAYVGVAAVEDDGVDFTQRMGEIHRELLQLQIESNDLMATISKNLEEMGI